MIKKGKGTPTPTRSHVSSGYIESFVANDHYQAMDKHAENVKYNGKEPAGCGYFVSCVKRSVCPIIGLAGTDKVNGSWNAIEKRAKQIAECTLFILYLDADYLKAIQISDLSNYTRMELQLARLHCLGRTVIVFDGDDKSQYKAIDFDLLKPSAWIPHNAKDVVNQINLHCPKSVSTPASYVDTTPRASHDLLVKRGTSEIKLSGNIVSGSVTRGIGIFCNSTEQICYSGPFEGSQPKNGLYRLQNSQFYEYWLDPSSATGATTRNGYILYWETPTLFYHGDWKDDKRHGKGFFTNGLDTYSGQWEEDKIQGTGVYSWKNGEASYSGQFKDNQPNGFGIFAWKTGTKLDGTFDGGKVKNGVNVAIDYNGGARYQGQIDENGKRHDQTGTAVYTFAIAKPSTVADIYTGNFANDLPHGQGKFERKQAGSEAIYEGAFENGAIKGDGKLKVNGNTFTGKFEGGVIPANKQVTIEYGNGDKYSGNLSATNKRNGNKHTYEWNDGTKYVGDFKDDKLEGRGLLTWTDGTTYNGEFADNHFVTGILNYSTGEKYHGNFNSSNQRHKGGQMDYQQGDVFLGEWFEDKKKTGKYKSALNIPSPFEYDGEYDSSGQRVNGQYTWLNSNGQTIGFYRGLFVKGIRQGVGTMSYEDKSIYTGNWSSDMKDSKKKSSEAASYLDKTATGPVTAQIPSDEIAYILFAGGKMTYYGEFEKDQIHGQGILKEFEDNRQSRLKRLFAGSFKNDKINGSGVYVEFDSGVEIKRYYGEFNESGCSNVGECYEKGNKTPIQYTCAGGKIVLQKTS